jgi:hypothetical protein
MKHSGKRLARNSFWLVAITQIASSQGEEM